MKKTIKDIILLVILLITLTLSNRANAFNCGVDTIAEYSVSYGTIAASDGNCWLDRNLGASRVATSSTDASSYGWFVQWGRGIDGHQLSSSGTTTVLSVSDTPGHANFIKNGTASPYDWRSTRNDVLWQGVSGINNPCPAGFRLPTQAEWFAVVSANGITNAATAFSSALKLPMPGYRDAITAGLLTQGSRGYYWSSGLNVSMVYHLLFDATSANPANTTARAHGVSVRCIADIVAPTVTTSAVSAIAATTAAGNGNVGDTGMKNPTRYIRWGTSSGVYTSSCSAGVGAAGAYACAMTGLVPKTTYYVQAYAANSAGTIYGGQTSFTTLASLSTVTTSIASSITSTTATGNGSITATGGENPTRYIQWGTTSGIYTNSCPAGAGAIGAYSCGLTGLSPNTTYYVRAYATNSAGTSYGAQTSFTTLAALPTLTTSTTSTILTTSATGNANLINIGGATATRDIEWGTTSGTYTSSCSAGTGSTGTYSCNLTSLTPDTTYYVRAKATNSAGTSYGSETSFHTLPTSVTISDPDITKMNTAISSNYATLNSGTITATPLVTTNIGLTLTASNAQLTLPTSTQITNTDTGNFNFENFTTQNVSTTIQQEISTSKGAVKIGVPNTKLTFSQPVTLSITVGTSNNGILMDVFYQNEGETNWNAHTSCVITAGQCTFTTTHATIYTVNGDGTMTGETGSNITATIAETISLGCGATLPLGTLTAGTPVAAQITCTTITNANGGYDLAVKRDDADTTVDHAIDATANITDKSAWTPITPNATTWTGTGLGFRVVQSGTALALYDTNFWGTDDTTNAKFAGFPAAYANIASTTAYSVTATDVVVGTKLDVPGTQKSGTYNGTVTFQVSSKP